MLRHATQATCYILHYLTNNVFCMIISLCSKYMTSDYHHGRQVIAYADFGISWQIVFKICDNGTHHIDVKSNFNPFMPNGISRSYHLDKFISNLEVVRWYILVNSIQILKVYFVSKQCKTLMRPRVLRCLIWFFTVCRCLIIWTNSFPI